MLLGIALPLYAAFRTASPPAPGGKTNNLLDLNLSLPAWILITAVLLAAALRFYKLETLFCWPTLDEGWNGTCAIELSRHWTWKFFYTFGEAPPLPVWCGALLFKLGCAPAFCLWFPSAVVSLLTLIAGTFAARQFYSKSFSLICAGLLAFSYWPLFIGRFCHQGIWLPLWICLCLWAWGSFLKSSGDKSRRDKSLLLGITLGLGSFTFTPWIGAAAFFFGSIAWGMVGSAKKDWRSFSFFSAAFFIGLLPFLTAVFQEGYGHHITSLSPWGGWFNHFNLFLGFFKYFAVLFWGSFEKDPAYTPLWGGFLNPLLGSFFFFGVIEMGRLRRSSAIQWTAAAFIILLLPGALSPNLETFRIAQVMPIMLFITALGCYSLLKILPSSRQGWVFVLACLLTAFVDFHLLAAPYDNPNASPENFGRPLKSLDRYYAWQVLNNLRIKNGPGFILTDFDVNAFNDPTLSVMTYSFNAARKNLPVLKDQAWSAVFVNVHYQYFLEKLMSKGQYYWVSKNLNQENGGNVLGVFQVNALNQNSLLPWFQAHFLFQDTDLKRFSQTGQDFSSLLKNLDGGYPLVRGNPFLESCFWDKRAAFEYQELNYEQQLFSYQAAVQKGFPTADLFYKLGELYRVKGRQAEAEEAYGRAVQAPLDLTQARKYYTGLKAKPAPPQAPLPAK